MYVACIPGCVLMCVGHWHKGGHIVMLYEQMTACPSGNVQLLPNLVDHQSLINPKVRIACLPNCQIVMSLTVNKESRPQTTS